MDARAVVHHVFGETDGSHVVANEVAGDDQHAAEGEGVCRLLLPGGVAFAAVPERGEDPFEGVVVLLFVEEADEVVQV